jgi:integrase
MRQLCRWLVRPKRLLSDSTAELRVLNVRTDRRHDRRALSQEVFVRLVQAAENGESADGIPGPDRSMMYILAACTGYRRGEIGSLTLQSFALDRDLATVTVSAAYSKHRQTDPQVLPPDLVTYVEAWLR